MKIEATVQEIRALVQLAQQDPQALEKPRETRGSPREAGSAVPRKALLDRYQSLLEAGRRPAIVAIERGHCSGCHVRLPTVVESRARMLPAVHICPHCRRLLYSPELLGADDQRLTGPEVGKPNERRARAAGRRP